MKPIAIFFKFFFTAERGCPVQLFVVKNVR